jgi:hypothetical protein
MKIGTFVASLVFLSSFGVQQKSETPRPLTGTNGGMCSDNDVKRLAQPKWSDILAIRWLVRYAICTWSMYSSKADRNGLQCVDAFWFLALLAATNISQLAAPPIDDDKG